MCSRFEGGALFKKETEGALIASRTGDFGDTLALVEFKKNEVKKVPPCHLAT